MSLLDEKEKCKMTGIYDAWRRNHSTIEEKIFEAEVIMEALQDVRSGNTVDGDTVILEIRNKYSM